MMKRIQPQLKLLLMIPLAALIVSCAAKPTPPASSLDLVPFQERARTAQCADEVNNLFLIDDAMVFWEIRGNCADASYGYTLFAGRPDAKLCEYHDSIAGPMKACSEDTYQAMFDTMIEHSEEPDLGLGNDHTVQPIPF